MRGDRGMTPGIHYGVDWDTYNADPVPGGSLRASVAATLIEASPLHALHADNALREATTAMDIGTAAHALILEGDESVLVEVPADDWRTNAAKEARDEARAAGKVPLLTKDVVAVHAMVDAFWQQLPPAMAGQFRDAKKEVTVIWDDAGLMCRGRFDAYGISEHVLLSYSEHYDDDTGGKHEIAEHGHGGIIYDLKTTAGTARPEVWAKSRMWPGPAVQAAFYTRGAKAVTGIEHDYRLLVLEQNPPHALAIVGLDPHAMSYAQQQADVAISVWRECRATGRYPGYDPVVHWAAPPPWAVRTWEEMKLASKAAREQGVTMTTLQAAMAAQRPLEWG
ncbi:MAG: hypothetical protein EA420_16410 [Candidatus Competibacteraceae bacterium]|nr:MAG: hypothetical protein EA420_16410 [Candidatus Competibacteraceae bacterium]